MTTPDFTTTLLVTQSPAQVFQAINQVTAWWTQHLTGNTQNLGDQFTVQFGDVHRSTQQLVDVIPNQKVVWLVTDSTLNFLKDKQEWNGTKISFEISEQDGKTQIRFAHIGLLPEIECYNACSNAWGHYINGSLFKLITEGIGMPEQ